MTTKPNLLEATDGNFQAEVLNSTGVSVVDFWAEWCGPCRLLGPVIEQLSEEYQGKAKVYKMNVDENPSTPSKFNIRGIPTVIVFKDGQAVDQLVGNQPKDVLQQTLNKYV